VVKAGGESMRHTDVQNLHRCVFLNGAAISQLALIVHTPAPHRAIVFDCEAMAKAAGNGCHAKDIGLQGRQGVSRIAIAQLPIRIAAPDPKFAAWSAKL